MSRTPTMAEVLREAIAASLEDVHTAIPGRVTRYDVGKQQADVQPLIKVAYLDESGERVAALLPTVRNCPVMFPGGAGLTITYPIAAGDTGLLIFSEASLDKWLSGSGDEVEPDIDLRHHLTDGIFIPGVRPFGGGGPRSTDPGSTICIGVDGGTFEGIPIASRLATLFNNHVHGGPGTPPTVPVTADANPVTGFASTTVKVTP
jgi:hypothetical protein